ncbi:MAG: hypothetical protein A3C84_01645 [Candidatus Ryanbacteria bacterium RIFCSPHIGHO2_02_FULL_48_12]|uniref:PKD domain-containing protein n=1 Tax=Candidatus Ryanbacteria bacterium RIFCSPHIGHO2_01_FULL_48_27 TaxID=1802115 RepID=A0A1G2G7Z7_9BACT|nr:MAG: hypothetical protein A2756_06380 [Candidatus Ryanbacteria bacterium RIFCSPHIGHO2_01_FULL_48_27]OGZ49185.1 MAG: hypothetical protein A3C84_01645 [Candidatus Ryanbacteria bacterium RIFCSPHIGHO2_02_FULL_48_12]
MHIITQKSPSYLHFLLKGVLVSLLFIFSLPIVAAAQSVGDVGAGTSIDFNPRTPGPNQSVEARVVSFSFDRLLASYIWYVDGKVSASGTGRQSTTFTTGKPGSRHIVKVVIQTNDGGVISTSAELTVGDIDLLWSAETTTPPGYPGRALPSIFSLVKVVALPNIISNGKQINPKSLSYEWLVNGRRLPASSGNGEDSLLLNITSSPDVETQVTVNVSTLSQSIKQTKTISIRPVAQKINFYEIDPARGPKYQRNIAQGFSLGAGSEAKILATPFYFNQRSFGFLDYVWKIAGQRISDPQSRPAILSFKTEQGSSGTKHVSLQLENPQNPLEIAEKSFIINVQ